MKIRAIIIGTIVLMLTLLVGVVGAQDDGLLGPPLRQPDGLLRELVQVVTDATGLTIREIRQQIQDGSTLAEIIEANGGNVDDVVEQATTLIEERVLEARDNNVISEDRANQILDNLQQRLIDFLNGELRNIPSSSGRRGNLGHRFGQRLQNSIAAELSDIVTETTGLTVPEIRQQVQDGSTLAEIIEANGGSVEDVVAQATAVLTERADEAVANGLLTQARADTLLQGVEERINAILNQERPVGPNRPQVRNPQTRMMLRAVANATGMDAADIVAQVQDGASLAEILTDNGVDVNTFVDEQVAQFQERLDEQVEAERISQAVADARLNLFHVELLDRLNRTLSPDSE